MQKLIIGNLKMNLLTVAERDKYLKSFAKELKGKKINNSHIILCPPNVHIETFRKQVKSKNVSIGSQNIFWEEKGSYTGEVSAPMVKNLGAEYVIVGHSERRKYFSEDNEIANAKIKMATKYGLRVIYCVGETAEQRQAGKTSDIIIYQVEKGLAGVPLLKIPSITIAYEPVWAVGSDLVPTSNEILEVRILLKKFLMKKYGNAVAEKIKILYGGSVKVPFLQQVCLQPQMDGVLIGRESLKPSEFLKIAEIIDK